MILHRQREGKYRDKEIVTILKDRKRQGIDVERREKQKEKRMTKVTEMKMEKDMKVLVGKQTDTYIDRETTIKEKIKGHPIDDTEPTKHRDK